jgi:hypothetical protein
VCVGLTHGNEVEMARTVHDGMAPTPNAFNETDPERFWYAAVDE